MSKIQELVSKALWPRDKYTLWGIPCIVCGEPAMTLTVSGEGYCSWECAEELVGGNPEWWPLIQLAKEAQRARPR